MNEYSSPILDNIAKAPLSEQRTTPNGEVWYFGFPKQTEDGVLCRIERITKNSQEEGITTYTTEHVGFGFFRYDWDLRETYDYTLKLV